MITTRTHKARDKGFSLVELLVVVSVLAVLSAIAIPTYLGHRDSAYRATASSDLRGIAMDLTALVSGRSISGWNNGATAPTIANSGSSSVVVTYGSGGTATGPATLAVHLSSGTAITGNMPSGTASPETFCLKAVTGGQIVVMTDAGLQAGKTTCTAGVAS